MKRPAPAVLVVEDDASIREALNWHLKGAGYEPVTAEDGAKGWALLEAEPERYAAVLLDRSMPRMDGMEVLSRIKAHEVLKTIPVIMETAKAGPEEMLRGLEAGAYYYLTKPFDRKTLLAIVKTAVADRTSYLSLCDETRRIMGSFSLMVKGLYAFRTLQEAKSLATLVAHCCPDPERIVFGLSELLTNAVEHGNLGITYHDKSRLMEGEEWEVEVSRRLGLPENRRKNVTLEIERRDEEIEYRIRDRGDGFDWREYLEFKPERAFDTHGRGIAMARQISFDHVQFNDKGNEVAAITRTA